MAVSAPFTIPFVLTHATLHFTEFVTVSCQLGLATSFQEVVSNRRSTKECQYASEGKRPSSDESTADPAMVTLMECSLPIS